MSLLNKEQTYATGLVKPKTTSIFFDKILVTDDLLDKRLSMLGYADIPNEILLQPHYLRYSFSHELAHFFMDMDMDIQKRTKDNIHDIMYDLLEQQGQQYKYSVHRNHRIYESIEFYRRVGINIVPIYFSPTEYEQHFLPDNNKDLLSPTISICINEIPEIVEEKLSWDQVVDIRNDKEAIAKVRRFKNWITLELADKNESEIRTILEQSLDDYSWALKKHGITTTVGAISTVQSVGATLVEALNERTGFLLSGLIISAGVTVFAVNSFADAIETKRHPIAIIYDLVKRK